MKLAEPGWYWCTNKDNGVRKPREFFRANIDPHFVTREAHIRNESIYQTEESYTDFDGPLKDPRVFASVEEVVAGLATQRVE